MAVGSHSPRQMMRSVHPRLDPKLSRRNLDFVYHSGRSWMIQLCEESVKSKSLGRLELRTERLQALDKILFRTACTAGLEISVNKETFRVSSFIEKNGRMSK